MIRLLLLTNLLLQLIPKLATAQNQNTFQIAFGDSMLDDGGIVLVTADQGYLLLGTQRRLTTLESQDVLLVRTDFNGDTLWTKRYGGNLLDYANDIKATADGGYIITAATKSYGSGDYDILLIKIDSIGNTTWAKAIGNSYFDVPVKINTTADGGYLLFSSFVIPSPINLVGNVLSRLDANGDTLWTRKISMPVPVEAEETADGGYLALGTGLSNSVSGSEIYLRKLDVNANVVWSKTIGGTDNDFASALHQLPDGNLMIYGITRSFGGSGFYDRYLIKLDSTGNHLWSKCYGDSLSNETSLGFAPTNDGGFILGGSSRTIFANSSKMYLIKVDSDGDTLWTNGLIGSLDIIGLSIKPTADSGYIASGNSASFGSGGSDLLLVKTDEWGNTGCNNSAIATNVYNTSTSVISTTTTATNSSATYLNITPGIINGTKTALVCSTTVSIASLANPIALEIYPNPASNTIHLLSDAINDQSTVQLYDIMGNKIFSSSLDYNNFNAVDISNLSNGLYLLHLLTTEGVVAKKVMVVNK